MSNLSVTQNSTTRKLPTDGVTVPAPCPICGGAVRWQGRTWHLTCAGCTLAVTLEPDEARDLAWYLAVPGLHDTPLELFLGTVLARHHIAGAIVAPDPKLIGTQAGGFKWRVVPGGAETGAQRAARLAEQAALNGVQIVPCNAALTEFLVSSQRRDAAGEPAAWYRVSITPWQARCSCPADGLCAHLSAVHSTLLDMQAADRERTDVAWNSKSPEAQWANEDALIDELWGRG